MIEASLLYLLILSLSAPLLGKYIAFIYTDNKTLIKGLFKSQTWKKYFISLMSFNLICIVTTFIIIYFQQYLPYGEDVKPINFALSLNAAVSFSTSTFWQSHDPETELSIFSHIFALTAQNFLSASSGLTVFVAFIRGLQNNNKLYIGNFYADFLKAMLCIFLPASLIIALLLISFGMPHDFTGHINFTDLSGNLQEMFIGPVAGQTAIKTLASNGGSIFAAASAHPFEVPSRFIVIFQLWLVLLLPASLIFTYGFLTKEPRLSWSLYFVVMFMILIAGWILNYAENKYSLSYIFPNINFADNFNITGKEMIYDKFPSLTWILAIATSSSGSQNLCMENLSPIGMLILFFNLVIGKFMLEGVGSGFFTMLTYLMIAVFIKGLITGHTQNFCGKKISVRDINYVMILLLFIPIGILLFSSVTFITSQGIASMPQDRLQAITDVTYNFASVFTNNGSLFGSIDIRSDYFNYMSAIAMFTGRYATLYYSLALCGSFAGKSKLATNEKSTLIGGDMSIFLVILVLMIGAVTFIPVLLLGPLAELMKM